MSEALEIEVMLNDFVDRWQSHGDKVKGYANLIFGQFFRWMLVVGGAIQPWVLVYMQSACHYLVCTPK